MNTRTKPGEATITEPKETEARVTPAETESPDQVVADESPAVPFAADPMTGTVQGSGPMRTIEEMAADDEAGESSD